jgi:AraC-like DNA-binding protein
LDREAAHAAACAVDENPLPGRLVGRPPLNYLTWWRMTTAARLLRESDAPLATVAREVGYSSEFAFASAFKRRYAVAPGRYRREGRVGVA